jgi:hypothetical protein
MPRPQIAALISALLAVAVFAPASMAQRGGGFSGFGRSVGASFSGQSHSHSFGRSFGRDAIFFGDPFYADYPVAPVTIPPEYVVVPPAARADTPPETKSEPLMIELQGNRYVRFGGGQPSSERGMNPPRDFAEVEAGNSSQAAQRQAQLELPPTVLIFRDGHREQVPGYAIVGDTIYASGDYWQSGHWTKNIQVSALNIPETVRANRDNGVKFMLPSGPNEVITRP